MDTNKSMENRVSSPLDSNGENKENQEVVAPESKSHQIKRAFGDAMVNGTIDERAAVHYSVVYSKYSGRSLVASRDLPAGHLILQEKPMVLGPTAASAPVCLACHAPVCTLYRCFKCQWPMCSEVCASHESHVEECHILAQDTKRIGVPISSDPTPRYDLIVILRCLLLKEKDPKKWDILMSFENHWEIRKVDAEAHHMAAVRYFTKVCPTGHDENTLHKVRGAIMTNCINSRCSSGISLRGLYPKISLLNHSCRPNTSLRSDKNCQLYINTSVTVSGDEPLTFSYVPPGEPYWKRQRDLHDIYYFNCMCERCSDRTELNTHFSSLKCKKCSKSFIDPMLNKRKIYRCGSCRFSIPQVKVMHISIALQNLYASDDEIIDIHSAMHILKEIHSSSHGKHYTWLACAVVILRALAKINSIDVHRLRKQLWMRVIDMYSILEPGMTRRRGVSLLQLTSVSVLLAIQDYNLARIPKALLQDELDLCQRHLREASCILDLEPQDSTEQRWILMAEKEQRRLEEVREQFIEMEKGEEFIEDDEKTLERFRDVNHHRKMKELETLTDVNCQNSDRNSDSDSESDEQ